jgi:CheY-like chemotaxis protein
MPRTLLIVDDDRALCAILGWGFEDLGYAVWTAADCAEALACATAMRFDFALVDYRLPDGNGHALCHTLTRRQRDLQLVLMSADRATAAAEIGEPGLAAALIEKPVPLRGLHRYFCAAHALKG